MNTRPLYAETVEDLSKQVNKLKLSSFRPTLGIIFCSPSHDLNAICKLFDDLDIDLFGCSTAGEILFEEVYETSIVGILTDMKTENYDIITKSTNGNIYQAAFEMGLQVTELYKNPAIMLASGGVIVDAEKIINGLDDSIKKNIPIFGGLAADDLELSATYSLSRKGADDDGLVFLVFDNDKISVNGMATSGWEAIGNIHTITKAEGNVVYTIDDKPALDVFINYFGYFDDLNLQGKHIDSMSAQYPLQIIRDNYSVLRSPLIGSEEEKTLILAGGVKQGDQFRFSISPGFEVIDQTIQEFQHLQHETPETDLMVLFSCKGRHAALGPLIEDEIIGINNYWDAPLIGFFSYGEFGNVKNGKSDFHNETCSLVLIKELESPV